VSLDEVLAALRRQCPNAFVPSFTSQSPRIDFTSPALSLGGERTLPPTNPSGTGVGGRDSGVNESVSFIGGHTVDEEEEQDVEATVDQLLDIFLKSTTADTTRQSPIPHLPTIEENSGAMVGTNDGGGFYSRQGMNRKLTPSGGGGQLQVVSRIYERGGGLIEYIYWI